MCLYLLVPTRCCEQIDQTPIREVPGEGGPSLVIQWLRLMLAKRGCGLIAGTGTKIRQAPLPNEEQRDGSNGGWGNGMNGGTGRKPTFHCISSFFLIVKSCKYIPT